MGRMTSSEVKRLRKQTGLSRDDFGALVHTTGVTVWRWENDVHSPAPAVAELLRTKVAALLQNRASEPVSA